MTKCAVKNCKNYSSHHLKKTGVTYHRFPQNALMREKWRRIIGKNKGDEDYKPSDSTIVCSRHFLESDMYLTGKGFRRLKKTALPQVEVYDAKSSADTGISPLPSVSDLISKIEGPLLEVCRVCLATDVRMYKLQHKLLKYFKDLFDIVIKEDLPQFICYECRMHLLKYQRLVQKSMIAQATLLDIFAENGEITKSLVKKRNRKLLNLHSSLKKESIFLLELTDSQEDNILNKQEYNLAVKTETIDKLGNRNKKENAYNENCYFIKDEEAIASIPARVICVLTNESRKNDLCSEDDKQTYAKAKDLSNTVFKSDRSENFKTNNRNSKNNLKDGDNDTTLNDDTERDTIVIQHATEDISNEQNNDNEILQKSIVKGHSTKYNESLLPLNSDEKNVNEHCLKVADDEKRNPEETKIKQARNNNMLKTSSKKLTSDEAAVDKLKCYNIIELSFEEQLAEWKNEVEQPPWWTTEDVFTCEICLKKFPKKKARDKHTAQHELIRGNFVCPVCKERFQNKKRLHAHTVRTHSKRYLCSECPKVLHNYQAARRHQSKHSGQPGREGRGLRSRPRGSAAAPCSRCGRGFVSARGLATHYAKVHDQTDEPRELFKCEQCDVVFYTKGALNIHTITAEQHRTHATTNDPSLNKMCKRCGVTFDSRKELLEHVRAEHYRRRRTQGGEKLTDSSYPRPCEHCGMEMESRRKHWFHVIQSHRKLRHTYKPVVNTICEKCGKGFQTLKLLQLHELRHGNRQYSCAECPRKFYDHYALRRHAVTHTTTKPYPCLVCGRSFKYQNNLCRHMRIHTGAMPYDCNFCEKKFRYWESLDQHVKHMHQKVPWPARNRRIKNKNEDGDMDK